MRVKPPAINYMHVNSHTTYRTKKPMTTQEQECKIDQPPQDQNRPQEQRSNNLRSK